MAAEGPYSDEKAFLDAISSYNPFGDPGGNVRALSALHQRVGMKGVLPIIILSTFIPLTPVTCGLLFGQWRPVVYEAGDPPTREERVDGHVEWVLGAGGQITVTLGAKPTGLVGDAPAGHLARIQGKLVAETGKCPTAVVEWSIFADDRRVAGDTSSEHQLTEVVPTDARGYRFAARRTDSASCALPLSLTAKIRHHGWLL